VLTQDSQDRARDIKFGGCIGMDATLARRYRRVLRVRDAMRDVGCVWPLINL